ncbi:uncharacterized protein MELLADRAFT_92664 [Melampsora larici-populina 98AG31]|uniref:Uncharacterized protein n=1 Tax=Melampsora larici-populina (strain 98AG31 / pathotype 3-4-7) TaxID=747676 RepID=F4S2D3_MELLP|nr:uncharacterized protein MELLADRAFT_92664 [Melampsora larici-populina 98AG31]EGG01154.1 hypothetical protein MELLADRAFT_92664 [Melampsora larici-populina 98AG31]
MPTDPYIESVSKDPANPRFRCNACNTRGMANYEHHIKSAAHQLKVARFVNRLADEEQMLVGLSGQLPIETDTPVTPLMETTFEPDPQIGDNIRPPSPLTRLLSLDASDFLGTSFDTDNWNDTDAHIGFDRLRQALETLDNLEFDDDDNDVPEDEEPHDPNLARARAREAIEWHPFKNKEDC